jgi:hypothetical protein
MNYMDDLFNNNNNTPAYHIQQQQQQNYMSLSNQSVSLSSSLSDAGADTDDPIRSMSKRIIHVLQDEIALLWIIFGTIGNILSLMVLLRKKMRIHSTFTYLTLLALCDTFVLYFGLLRDYLVNNYDTHVYGDFLCKMHVFFFYFVLHMASWLLVAVNIDRLIAASFLSLSKKWCTPRTALTVSFYIAIGVFLVNSHFIYFVVDSGGGTTTLLPTPPLPPPLKAALKANLTNTFSSSSSRAADEYALPRNTSASPPVVSSLAETVDEAQQQMLSEPINPYVYMKCWIRPNNPLYTNFFRV